MREREKCGKVTDSGALAFPVLHICRVSCAHLRPVSDVQADAHGGASEQHPDQAYELPSWRVLACFCQKKAIQH